MCVGATRVACDSQVAHAAVVARRRSAAVLRAGCARMPLPREDPSAISVTPRARAPFGRDGLAVASLPSRRALIIEDAARASQAFLVTTAACLGILPKMSRHRAAKVYRLDIIRKRCATRYVSGKDTPRGHKVKTPGRKSRGEWCAPHCAAHRRRKTTAIRTLVRLAKCLLFSP